MASASANAGVQSPLLLAEEGTPTTRPAAETIPPRCAPVIDRHAGRASRQLRYAMTVHAGPSRARPSAASKRIDAENTPVRRYDGAVAVLIGAHGSGAPTSPARHTQGVKAASRQRSNLFTRLTRRDPARVSNECERRCRHSHCWAPPAICYAENWVVAALRSHAVAAYCHEQIVFCDRRKAAEFVPGPQFTTISIIQLRKSTAICHADEPPQTTHKARAGGHAAQVPQDK